MKLVVWVRGQLKPCVQLKPVPLLVPAGCVRQLQLVYTPELESRDCHVTSQLVMQVMPAGKMFEFLIRGWCIIWQNLCCNHILFYPFLFVICIFFSLCSSLIGNVVMCTCLIVGPLCGCGLVQTKRLVVEECSLMTALMTQYSISRIEEIYLSPVLWDFH